MRGKYILLLIFFALIAIDFYSFGQGCSQCKMLSTQGSEITEVDEAAFGTNINYGILYLMLIPYLLLMFLFRKKLKSIFLNLVRK